MSKHDRIIVFDWGGVILRICRSWREGCERAGLAYDEALDTPEIAEQRHAAANLYEVGELNADAFLGRVADTMHGRYSVDDIRSVHSAWLVEEYAGADDLLAELAAHPTVDTGLLSNTNHLHWIEHIDPADGGTGRFTAVARLQHRHASHLLGLAKPDPQIFAAFESHTGYTADRIVYFDDLPANVEAAVTRGWDAVQIDHTSDTTSQIRRALSTRGVLS